jgi:hypothetical protein
MPCAAGQASWAGTAPPPGLTMPLSQGHDRQSRSPAGLTRWSRLCAARVFHGDCHECVPGYAAYPPVSTPFFPVTATLRGCQGHHRARVASGWLVEACPQRRDREGFWGHSLFLSRTSVLHRRWKTPGIPPAPSRLKWWKATLCGMFLWLCQRPSPRRPR